MVRIAISQAAFDAILATLSVGSTGYENAVTGPAKAYSDVILRLAATGGRP
jgi:hypothetical protein